MQETLRDSLVEVCHALKLHGVTYLIVGGTAVGLHGHFRPSLNDSGEMVDKPGVDIWYHPTFQNYSNVLNVLEVFDYDVNHLRAELTPNPRQSFFKSEFDNFTLDLIPAIAAPVKFLDAYLRKEKAIIDDTEIFIMGYHDLIAEKKVAGRDKDLLDIEHLKNIRKNTGDPD